MITIKSFEDLSHNFTSFAKKQAGSHFLLFATPRMDLYKKANNYLRVVGNIKNFLNGPLEVKFYLLVVPFRIKINQISGNILEQWKPHQIICGLLTLISLCTFLEDIYQATIFTSTNDSSKLEKIFEMIYKVAYSIRKIMAVKILWFEQKTIMAMYNHLDELSPLLTKNTWLIGHRGISLFLGFGNVLLSLSYMWNKRYDSIKRFADAIAFDMKFALESLRILGIVHGQLIYSLSSVLLFSNVMIAWTTSRSFADLLKNHSNKLDKKPGRLFFWREIESHLNGLRRLTDLVNKLISHSVTLNTVEVVLYYAIGIQLVISGDKIYNGQIAVLQLFFYFSLSCMAYIMAAEVARNVGILKEWLYEPENRALVMPPWDTTLIWCQLEANSVATLNASNVFPVTYGFISSVRKTIYIFERMFANLNE